MRAYVGGFFGECYDVIIDFTTGSLTWKHGEGNFTAGIKELCERKLDESTLDRLVAGLRRVNLLDWNAKYPNLGICDGTQWFVEITINGETVSKHGDNSFPAEWDAFCRLISRISGREFR